MQESETKTKAAGDPAAFLLFIVRFVASCREEISALAAFIGYKGTGFSGTSSHPHKYLCPLTAVGAFYFRKTGRVFSFVASIQQHSVTSAFS
jgi:hypothetical protein